MTVRHEGMRDVNRTLEYYNLDMIIAVGYRVNSRRATQFRQWATKVLRDFALRYYVLDGKRMGNGIFLLTTETPESASLPWFLEL